LPLYSAPWHHWWLAAVVAMAAAVVVYWPTLDNGLINWDDFEYLTKNDYVAESGGLKRIWDPDEKHEQFYPMVFSSFWLEHKFTLWLKDEKALADYSKVDHLDRGFDPAVHHATNLILHALCAGLVVWLLRVIGVSPWVAWLTAMLFAVHPINVASVAWTAERKNVLSGVFYLLSLILYLRHTRWRNWVLYGLCLVLYVLALMSKSAMMTLPATAIIADRLIEGRWSWKSWVRVAPMLAFGAYSAYLTKTTEVANAGSTMVPLDPLLRPLAASGAIWFYVGKLLVPYHFPGVYTRWDLQGHWPLYMAALVGLLAAAWLMWVLRRRIPGHALWGLGHFVLSLSPMLGLIAFNYTQFSFVADHFVYLSSVGVFLCVGLLVDFLRRRATTRAVRVLLPTGLAVLVLAGLATASFIHCRTVWKDGETFWVYTLRLNPSCWPGHYNLSNIYRRQASPLRSKITKLRRQVKEAETEAEKEELRALLAEYNRQRKELLEKAAEGYRRAAECKDGLSQAHVARGDTLCMLNRFEEAISDYEAARKIRPNNPRYLYYLADALTRSGREEEAVEHLRKIIRNNLRHSRDQVQYLVGAHNKYAAWSHRQGRYDEAIKFYDRALKIDPNNGTAKRGRQAAAQAREQEESGTSAPD
jgi:Flp pilus assembly protein TadD